ncbi:MAG: peptidase S10 [Bacteroidota bacterium]
MKRKLTLSFLLLFATSLLAQPESPFLEGESGYSFVTHSLKIAGSTLEYDTWTGYLPMRDEAGELKANVFFVYYRKKGERAEKRPITFTFNGGPGSSSVWLHMGGLGPRRILMDQDGASLAPPYEIVDNPHTWLTHTDLVFIDPMMTGFTRPAEGVDKKEFLGYEEDIRLVGDFIRLFTTRAQRWASPKFLAGESYGTTRASGLSGYLQKRHGMYLNGLMLISAVLDFSTIRYAENNDKPNLLIFPTMAATSRFHGMAGKSDQSLAEFLQEVETFTQNEYSLALLKGDQLSEAEKKALADKMATYTGLSPQFIQQSNFRLQVGPYNKELLRDKSGETVGRLDSRFKSYDYKDAGERYEFDPSYNATIYGPFTTAINDYVARELGYQNDLPYEILTGRARPWNYSNVQNRYLDVSQTLREAMTQNPYLKVWVANGYYDMATPYYATEHTLNHMFLKPQLKENIRLTYYEAGHMMYIDLPSLEQFAKDVRSFVEWGSGQE